MSICKAEIKTFEIHVSSSCFKTLNTSKEAKQKKSDKTVFFNAYFFLFDIVT